MTDEKKPAEPPAPIDPKPPAPVDQTPPAPIDPTPTAPVDQTPSAPVDSTPPAPVDQTPPAPVDPTPPAPVDQTPPAPIDSTPPAPVDPTPTSPVDPTPPAPVDQTPPAPVDLTPPSPVDLTPPAPVDQTPPAPVDLTPPAPVDQTPPAPVDSTPPAPVDSTPPAPVDQTPPAPVDQTPSAPIDQTPPPPVDQTPPAPVDQTPPAPVDQTPPAPVDQTPPAPVDSTPPSPVDPTPPAPSPVDPTPSAPVDQTPSAPVDQTPPAPVDKTPPAPVDQIPPAPVDSTPPAPVDSTPPSPVYPTPSAPVDQTPLAPVDQTPSAPVDQTPPDPVDQTPPAPVDKTPPAPVDPTLPPEEKVTGQEMRDALYNLPWSSIFAPYPHIEYQGGTNFIYCESSSTDSSSSEDDDIAPVVDLANHPELPLCETGPSSPVLSPTERADAENLVYARLCETWLLSPAHSPPEGAAPLDQTPLAPVDQTPSAPVDQTRPAPVDQTPQAPVDKTPPALVDPTPPPEEKVTAQEMRDALYNLPWSSIFAPYPHIEYQGGTNFIYCESSSTDSSSSEDDDIAQVVDLANNPELPQLCETGPLSPVLSPTERADAENLVYARLCETGLLSPVHSPLEGAVAENLSDHISETGSSSPIVSPPEGAIAENLPDHKCETAPSSPVLSPPEGAVAKTLFDHKQLPATGEEKDYRSRFLLSPLLSPWIWEFPVPSSLEGDREDVDTYDPTVFYRIDDKEDVDIYDPNVFYRLGAGLVNVDNICFMNSVLQCLVHTVPFFEAIIYQNNPLLCVCPNGKFCIKCSLEEIFRSLTSGRKYFVPKTLVRNLSHISPTLKVGRQEDAHEFLLKLWNKLMECDKYRDDKDNEHKIFVKRLFGGRLVNKFMCLCGKISSKTEDVWDLQLPIENSDTLIGALQAYIVTIVPDFRCENCGNEGIVQKIDLDRLQPIVTFHLKRFDRLNKKIKKHVSFPPQLDLIPFTPRKVTFPFTSVDKMHLYYELYAIIVHEGETPVAGHYYSFIRLNANEWYKYDDSRITAADEEEVFKQMAYILFYRPADSTSFTDAVLALQSSDGFISFKRAEGDKNKSSTGIIKNMLA
ncbi:mucin-5AC-like isoform X8 [Salvia splendens]|uniref:mucin-5AC-like isoform X8 n=1 Tax=Salvia splendens TaxID=180675 RepID=UPI001C262D86|nr:mucin-5AC-like isoform X8 [Salvia splendens]